ncbi:MAG: hypothetical protein K2G69_05570 [Muribaculaceae bacterium]|nr:hypothetical protein [Muribaculaceae bacterium]
MTRTIGDYIVLLLSIIGSLASIIAFGIFFAPHLNDQGMWGVIFLGVLALFFLFYNFYLIRTYRKKVRYSEIFAHINAGFSSLHSIIRQDRNDPTLILQNLSNLCDWLAQAFNVIYEEKVGVCIKFLRKNEQGKRVSVQTLVRDTYSKTIQRKTGTNDTTQHWIDGNSDFDFIYSNFDDDNVDTSFYHEAHLPVCKDYKNTRIHGNWMAKKPLRIFENMVRRKLWPLKYRSTLVVPIVPLLADEQSQDTIIGFLCIDSPKEGRFNNTVDVDILRGVSDGMYNLMNELYQSLNKGNGKT